jgi:DNA invertase Pin-like site-specific DNA recombinase
MAAARIVNQHPTDADILLRVSTTGQADDTRFSLPTQESACRAFADTHGWNVHSIQQDAITGETIYRPGFQAVLDDLAAGRVGRVIVYDVDRAGRDTYVGATLLHACKEAGATLHIEQMPDLELGGTGPAASYAEAMFFWRLTQAAQELAGIRERTARGRAARVASGKPNVAAVPLFGYQYVRDGRGKVTGFREHPIYGEVVRRIFREVAAGVTLADVCRGLERDGIPTRSQVARELAEAEGRPVARYPESPHWRKQAIAELVQHPAYSGEPAANRRRTVITHDRDPETGQVRARYHHSATPKDEQVALSTDMWPPLVDARLAAQARARLQANQEESARRLAAVNKEATLLRGGYVYCFTCGRPMTIKRYSARIREQRNGSNGETAGQYAYFCQHLSNAPGHLRADHCGQSISAVPLDGEVWEHVLRLSDEDEDVIETAMREWRKRLTSREASERAALRNAKHLLEMARRDEANKRRTLHGETDEHYAAQLRVDWKAAVDVREQAEARLADLEEQLARDPAQRAYADMLAWARDWRHRLSPDTPYAERRQALQILGLRVFVYPAEHSGRAGLAAQGMAGGEPRHFVVVVGWPQGVRQAIPGTVNPLAPEWEESGYPGAYLAEYFPGLEILDEAAADHHGMYSEVARLVPADVPAQELLSPIEDVGTRLGQLSPSDNSNENPEESGAGDVPFTSGIS